MPAVAELESRRFFIDGAWVAPEGSERLAVVDPSTETAIAEVTLGAARDAERAIAAARRAFPAFSSTPRAERLALLRAVTASYRARLEDFAQTVSAEMGAPITLARDAQAPAGLAHLECMIDVLERFEPEERQGSTLVSREPIGVVGMITPWNWPLNQILAKVAPALAAGCTMVLKPSEVAPLNAALFAEAVAEAGVPPGVFNLVHGTGETVGSVLSAHPEVDMVSFTGSTRAGVAVAMAAAPTVKRVHQELGGKSANILLEDADLEQAVREGVAACFLNSGQSCDAPTRMFVPRASYGRALEIAAAVVDATSCGDPRKAGPHLGPLANATQFRRVQAHMTSAERDGARLIAGGPGRPAGFARGFFARPSIYAAPDHRCAIAREEVFGPVLAVIPYDTEGDAVRMANDTPYGLAAYVQSPDLPRARAVARQLRAGNVHLNYPAWQPATPFGGYKQSGNGRENGLHGLAEFHETKAILGYLAP